MSVSSLLGAVRRLSLFVPQHKTMIAFVHILGLVRRLSFKVMDNFSGGENLKVVQSRRQTTSECSCLLLASFMSEDQQQRGADLENLWHSQEKKCVFLLYPGQVQSTVQSKAPKCSRPLPQAQKYRNANVFQRFSRADSPTPTPKSPGVLCMPRAVLGFRPTSFCSASETSQGYHKHSSSIPVGSSTPHDRLHHTGSADVQRVRVVTP